MLSGFPRMITPLPRCSVKTEHKNWGLRLADGKRINWGEQPSAAQIQAHMDGTASLSISTNKSQIQMDGIDAATITVTASDNTYAGKIWFAVQFPEGNIEEVADNFVAGVALLTLTSEQYGVHRITAIAPGYGQASLEIEGV